MAAGGARRIGVRYTGSDQSEYEYDMRHRGRGGSRGRAIIITNERFERLPNLQLRCSKDKLVEVMRMGGFRGHDELWTFDNLTARQMILKMNEVAELDFHNMDCLFVIVLSYGDKYHNIYGTDTLITYNMIMEPFMCAGMKDVPKVFMLQATPTPDDEFTLPEDVPVLFEMQDDGVVYGPRLPYPLYKASDFLLIYTLLKGPAFIDAFREVMRTDGNRLEIIQLVSRTSRIMSYPSKIEQGDEPVPNKTFPGPHVLSMMTKALYFA